MKNIKRYILTITILMAAFCQQNANATIATPNSYQFTQPDGTVITLSNHGDEFLHWTTCGNSLVEIGPDGYYYYASFNADGTKKLSSSKVSATGIKSAVSGASVVPPQSAIDAANAKRQERYQARLNSSANGGSNKVASAPSKSISVGNNKFLVVLVDFNDVRFTVNGGGEGSKQAFDDLLNKQGYSDNGGCGSVKDYYSDNSLNQFTPQYDVFGPITVSKNLEYYAQADEYVPELLAEACALYDDQIDFSQYDLDNDGYVDNIFMYYAGWNEAEGNADTIWPHQWAVFSQPLHDGKRIYSYACTSEYKGKMPDKGNGTMAGIGTFCHEFGHVIGLPDMYDTDYGKGGGSTEGYGLGQYSLMSSGSYNNGGTRPPYFNCEERRMLGWIETIPTIGAVNELIPIQQNGCLTSVTANDEEYFLYEFRNAQGWDTGLKTGLAIYHVDKSNNMVDGKPAYYKWNDNTINSVYNHPCMEFERASIVNPLFGSNGYKSFTDSTTPAAKDWAGNPTGFNITDITIQGTNSVSFACSISNEMSIRVSDINGKPIAGAKVTMTPIDISSSAGGKFTMGTSSVTQSPLVFYTDLSGVVLISTTDLQSENYSIVVVKDGYLSTTVNFNIYDAQSVSIVLNYPPAESDAEIKKYDFITNAYFGMELEDLPFSVAMSFSPEEIRPYVGFKFETISFKQGNCASVYVEIYQNGSKILSKKVSSFNLNDGSLTTVDISDENIVISPNSQYYIGYKVVEFKSVKDQGYLFADDGTNPAGTYISYDGSSWLRLHSAYNAIISAQLSYSSSQILDEAGINYMKFLKEQYSDKEKLTLKMIQSSYNPYSSITWEVNGKNKEDGSFINLQKGQTYKVKATLTYPSGKVEIITTNIVVP